jgi:hypothetical protein
MPAPAPTGPHYQHWPLYWFAQLEAALEGGDLAQAADAQLQLEQLGLRVRPLAPWTGAGLGERACSPNSIERTE